jgi:hypothetical protein
VRLSEPKAGYDAKDEKLTRAEIMREDGLNIKRGDVLEKILLRDLDTGEVKTLTVESGALVIT